MKVQTILLLLAAAIAAACIKPGPTIVISDVQVIAPAPGRAATVAYFTIMNDGDALISIVSVNSPQFAQTELHETRVVDGIAQMGSLDSVEVKGGASASFAPGGKHVMLLEPPAVYLPGTEISLRIRLASGDVVVVNAPLASRLSTD